MPSYTPDARPVPVLHVRGVCDHNCPTVDPCGGVDTRHAKPECPVHRIGPLDLMHGQAHRADTTACQRLRPTVVPAPPARVPAAETETRTEYGVKLNWDDGRVEHLPEESLDTARRRVTMHERRRAQLGDRWRATADLIQRTVTTTTGPWSYTTGQHTEVPDPVPAYLPPVDRAALARRAAAQAEQRALAAEDRVADLHRVISALERELADARDRIAELESTPAGRTEWTWRHNRHTSTASATTDRDAALSKVRRLAANNPGDHVALVTRTVTDWTAATAEVTA